VAASLFRLRGNHRTSEGSALPRLLDAVRAGDRAGVELALAGGHGVEWLADPRQRADAMARALSWNTVSSMRVNGVQRSARSMTAVMSARPTPLPW